MPQKMTDTFKPAADLMALVKDSKNGIDFESLKKGIGFYQDILQESFVVRQTTARSHRRIADELSTWFDNNRNVTPEMVFKKVNACLEEGKAKKSGMWGKSVLYQLLAGYVKWYEAQRAVNIQEIQRLYSKQLADQQAIIEQQKKEIERLFAAKEPLQKQAHDAQVKLNEATGQLTAARVAEKTLTDELQITKEAFTATQNVWEEKHQADVQTINHLQQENNAFQVNIARIRQERDGARMEVNQLRNFLTQIKSWLKTPTFAAYFRKQATACEVIDQVLTHPQQEVPPHSLLHSEQMAALHARHTQPAQRTQFFSLNGADMRKMQIQISQLAENSSGKTPSW